MNHAPSFQVNPEEIRQSNLSETQDRLFKLLQRDVIKAEMTDHPDMTEVDWIVAYSAPYRALLISEPEFLDRYEDLASREEVIAEVRRRLSH